jgi:hypothetical protein
MIITLVAATVAAQATPAPRPNAVPAPTADSKMACCEKMSKGGGCACCKGMANEEPDSKNMDHQ